MMIENPFTYESEGEWHDVVARIPVPARVMRKEALFTILADGLSFPEYFGENWDAFEECLRDLSWLPAGRVVLVHADIALIQDVANAKLYLAVLNDAIQNSPGECNGILFRLSSRSSFEIRSNGFLGLTETRKPDASGDWPRRPNPTPR
jgi:hypothetical protein